MSQINIDIAYLYQLAELDDSIQKLNEQKVRLLFTALDIGISDDDFEKLVD